MDDALRILDAIRSAGRIEYNDYSELHDAISMIQPESELKWTLVKEQPPKKYGWYICSMKDGRVCSKYWTGKKWIDNIRKHMFELYDIYGKITGDKVSPEDEDINWDNWVVAWMPLPASYQEEK